MAELPCTTCGEWISCVCPRASTYKPNTCYLCLKVKATGVRKDEIKVCFDCQRIVELLPA